MRVLGNERTFFRNGDFSRISEAFVEFFPEMKIVEESKKVHKVIEEMRNKFFRIARSSQLESKRIFPAF